MKVLIFLRQTEGKSNWKIDTISVVQERNMNEAVEIRLTAELINRFPTITL